MHRANMDDQAERVNAASLSLLEDPGIRIEHDAVAALLLAGGARPGAASSVVRFPRGLVEDALAAAPRSFVLAARCGPAVELAPDSTPVFWSVPGMSLFRNGAHRPFTSADMADAARLLDRLPSVHAVFGMALDDVPPPARDVAGLNIIARNSGKHVRVLCFSPQGAETLVRMQAVVRQRAPGSASGSRHTAP